MDVSRLKALGWQAKTSLEAGMRIAYESYVSRVQSATPK
jgi:GDP-L-fucose synthase